MRKVKHHFVFSHLLLMTALAFGQAEAATSIKSKKVVDNNKPAISIISTKTKALPTKKQAVPPTTASNHKRKKVNPNATTPNRSMVGTKPVLKNGLGKSAIPSHQNGINDYKALNGFKHLNPLDTRRANNIPSSGIDKKLPGRQRKSSRGLHGKGASNAAGGSFGTVRDHRGGVSTFTSMSGKRVMFPTPEGGTHQNPHSNGNLAEMSRDGDMYVIESDGTTTFVLAEEVVDDPIPSTGTSSDSNQTNNSSRKNDHGNDSKDNQNSSQSDNNRNQDDTDEDDTSSEDNNSYEDSSSDDGDTNDQDTDTGDTEGSNENTTSPGGHNTAPDNSKVYCASNPYDPSCKQPESTKPEPCAEGDGSGRVAQPGPEGESNCVLGNLGSSDDEENSAPSVEDNLPVNTGMTAEDRRNMVINPTGIEERMDDRNHALETIEAIEGVVNPTDQ